MLHMQILETYRREQAEQAMFFGRRIVVRDWSDPAARHWSVGDVSSC